MDDDSDSASGFAFDGNWRDYAPIAFTNLLLSIVTLGIYRFWAQTRTRRYLWSHTHFIDDRLEWTGTGKELFLGFLMAALLIGGPFLFIQFGAQALVLHGEAGLAGMLSFLSVIVILFMAGLARFRALRYRLSRTWWHGIRGGSDDTGFGYGLSYLWKSTVGWMAMGLLIPWSMMALWNERWRAMSFGPYMFEATATSEPTMKRFFLFYLMPFVGAIIFATVFAITFAQGSMKAALFGIVLGAIAVFGLYAALGVIALIFYAKFFRVAVDGLSLAGLDFHFSARTKDWFKLLLGDAGLVIVTLGVGMIFLEYRHWTFFVRHMRASGEIHTDALTQSQTKLSRHGEGLLDALDVGAF